MRKYIGLFGLLLLFNCSPQEKTELTDFDNEAWIADAEGCKNVRLGLIENLIGVKDELKGLNQNEIVALIGKPDRHELYKRSQKFFYYSISPSEKCEQYEDEKSPIYLSIRFNATGLAKEVLIMNYKDQ